MRLNGHAEQEVPGAGERRAEVRDEPDDRASPGEDKAGPGVCEATAGRTAVTCEGNSWSSMDASQQTQLLRKCRLHFVSFLQSFRIRLMPF